MAKRVWVDARRARAGALFALVGLVLLAATLALRGDADNPSCASLNPERAQECVAEHAQAIDRERTTSMLATGGAVALMTMGGALVLLARRRVLNLAEAAQLLETDVEGVRLLIANGDLVSITSDGRTNVDAAGVERLSQASKTPEGMARPGRA